MRILREGEGYVELFLIIQFQQVTHHVEQKRCYDKLKLLTVMFSIYEMVTNTFIAYYMIVLILLFQIIITEVTLEM